MLLVPFVNVRAALATPYHRPYHWYFLDCVGTFSSPRLRHRRQNGDFVRYFLLLFFPYRITFRFALFKKFLLGRKTRTLTPQLHRASPVNTNAPLIGGQRQKFVPLARPCVIPKDSRIFESSLLFLSYFPGSPPSSLPRSAQRRDFPRASSTW